MISEKLVRWRAWKICPTSMWRSLLAWAFAIAITVLAIETLKAPAPVSKNAPPTVFSAERAESRLPLIASMAHPTGSMANYQVKNYLVKELSAMGLEAQVLQDVGVRNDEGGIRFGSISDVIGYLPGSSNSRAVMLVAHYDSVYLAPGAADDGAGVAAILECVRALRSGPPLNNDLIVLFTDGEEVGQFGAEAFVASRWMKDVGLILNFEARGNRGPSLLFETSPGNHLLVKTFSKTVPHPIGSSLFYSLYKLLPNRTDFTAFRRYSVPGLNFAFGENLQAYHTRLDTAEGLSLASLQHHGEYALELARAFGQMNLIEFAKQANDDDVFFNWLGSHLISYSEVWVLRGQVFLTFLLVFTILMHIRHAEVRVGRVLFAIIPAASFALIIPSALAGAGALALQVLSRYITISDSSENSLLLTGLAFLGAWVGSCLHLAWRKYFHVRELTLAGLLVGCVLSWTVAIIVPGGSYMLFWPLLVATLVSIVSLKLRRNRTSLVAMIGGLSVAVSVLLFAPITYLIYIFFRLNLISISCLGTLIGLTFILGFSFIDMATPQSRWASTMLIPSVGCVTVLVLGAILPLKRTEYPRPDTIVYSLNADSHRAVWISYDQALDKWTSKFFSSRAPLPQAMPEYLAGDQTPVLSSPALALDQPPPTAEIKADIKEKGLRKVNVSLMSPRGAPTMFLRFDAGSQPLSVKMGGQCIIPKQGSDDFTITLFGTWPQGSDLSFVFPASSPISFLLMDRSFGLPESSARPDNLIPGFGSDVTLISKRYSF